MLCGCLRWSSCSSWLSSWSLPSCRLHPTDCNRSPRPLQNLYPPLLWLALHIFTPIPSLQPPRHTTWSACSHLSSTVTVLLRPHVAPPELILDYDHNSILGGQNISSPCSHQIHPVGWLLLRMAIAAGLLREVVMMSWLVPSSV